MDFEVRDHLKRMAEQVERENQLKKLRKAKQNAESSNTPIKSINEKEKHILNLKILHYNLLVIQKARITIFNRMYKMVQIYDTNFDYSIEDDFYINLLVSEKQLKKMITSEIEHIKIYTEYLNKIDGVGVSISAQLICNIKNILRFDNQSKLLVYCGYGLKDNKIQKKIKGQNLNYCIELKTALFMLATQLIKNNEYYRSIYDTCKAKDTEKNPTLCKAQLHNRALRKMIKYFVNHLWQKWRELEGLPCLPMYLEEKFGKEAFPMPPLRSEYTKKEFK